MVKKFGIIGVVGMIICAALYAVTTNMGLDLPVVGVTTGTTWATMINTALQTIDAHDHSSGKGVQIANAGISSSAAITRSKLASGGASLVLINDTTGAMSSETTLAVQRGGTNIGYYAVGDLLYACGPTSLCKLAAGSANQILKMASGLPSWATSSPTASPTLQKFTTGSGTYTLPTFPSPTYIVVEMVGAGGGGGAVATNAGATGGNTTFGGATASGGVGGSAGATSGPAGGAASLGSFTGVAVAGSYGGAGIGNTTGTVQPGGGIGGNSYFGGAGSGGTNGNAGSAAATNSGSGGGGGGGTSSQAGAPGGGAGGYVKAVISSPSATYSYAVGAKGTGGTAGTQAGGNGGDGLILVWEYY